MTMDYRGQAFYALLDSMDGKGTQYISLGAFYLQLQTLLVLIADISGIRRVKTIEFCPKIIHLKKKNTNLWTYQSS